MRKQTRTFPTRTLLALGLLVFCVQTSAAQAAPEQGVCKVTAAQAAKDETPPAADLTSGIRIKVVGPDGKTPVKRKRFYLLQSGVFGAGQQPDWSTLPRRADYRKGVSPELQKWLDKHDCDSLYCPAYEAEYEEAVKSKVPEFQKAYAEGLKKYKNEKLALRWVTVNFPLKNVRTEYYKRKRAWLEAAAGKAGKVTSVMTDEKGEAYFTGLKLGKYHVSNLVPLEDGHVVWDCAVTVPPPVPTRLHSVSVDLTYPKPAAAAPAK